MQCKVLNGSEKCKISGLGSNFRWILMLKKKFMELIAEIV